LILKLQLHVLKKKINVFSHNCLLLIFFDFLIADFVVAKSVEPKPISEIAKECGIEEEELSLYGKYKAKVSLNVVKRLQDKPQSNYVVVTG
jgi:hypothetical protein